ncbi:hypothetical protein BDV25DRAFT_172278 [Aspergillus avenaceus]|uniref:BZIP domain-containing protein n=1 Tax=Aspergillus avenaceus TaxID=36643 RepID=A0A5N6TV84_ASPAV|nr:hypothetical protein BDV25DRAFT_172278 [Aspergillus avenaceus]
MAINDSAAGETADLNSHEPSLTEAKNGYDVETADNRICVRQFSDRIMEWPEEDWSGISDPKQRRKLQNRLNQRVRRLRKRLDAKGLPNCETGVGGGRSHDDGNVAFSLAAIEQIHIFDPDSVRTKRILQQLEAFARTQYILGSPRTDMLLHLIQLNFSKALIENAEILGLTSEHLHYDAISPFNVNGPWQDRFGRSLPSTLQPTVIQRTVLHHPWLDLIPIAEMRDNLITAEDSYDETRLCLDMRGDTSINAGQTGVIVWRDPWDPSGWEVTELFARSWGWTLQGCWDLARSTNSWRTQRNERPLFRIY